MSRPSIGPLNLGRVATADGSARGAGQDDEGADDVEAVATNFERVRSALGVHTVVTVHQVHGADVLTVDERLLASWGPRHHLGEPGGAPALPVADAAVTTAADVALCVRVADCLPVLLADAEARVIGIAHAGRPGLAAGVLTATMDRMQALGGREISAWIGPHVCGACYEVPAEMRSAVARRHPAAYATTAWGTPALDLAAGAAAELATLGCTVHRVGPCTRTTPWLHSYRRDGHRAGRLGGFVWLRPAFAAR